MIYLRPRGSLSRVSTHFSLAIVGLSAARCSLARTRVPIDCHGGRETENGTDRTVDDSIRRVTLRVAAGYVYAEVSCARARNQAGPAYQPSIKIPDFSSPPKSVAARLELLSAGNTRDVINFVVSLWLKPREMAIVACDADKYAPGPGDQIRPAINPPWIPRRTTTNRGNRSRNTVRSNFMVICAMGTVSDTRAAKWTALGSCRGPHAGSIRLDELDKTRLGQGSIE